MSIDGPREIRVRAGRVQPSGSWIYVWIDVATKAVAYVGGTGFDPELRAHLHVTSSEPDTGRVRATIPRYDETDFDVLAFAVPLEIGRTEVKNALIAELRSGGGLPEPASPEVAGFVAHILSELDDRGIMMAFEGAVRPGDRSPR
ncbi:hypothetical protein QSU92_16040 [Microbacterium sp. ET2]|uniref:hypothetical protein n=1 Tax=Microbacterium albipurpureum TaxID=3050384 RepID=UPI00259C75AD|nr:hypothetical protein [Microbacterium sp. ET2 (Ac-2212)]WJL95418.1 hypothetical protein QSU92_16040 [Microbacterium sp. ET2 (Ac-2212)]